MGQVLKLRPEINSDSAETGIKTGQHSLEPSIQTTTSTTEIPQGYIKTEDLYPVRAEYNPALATAIKLLEESVNLVKESIKMFLDDDFISADDAIQRFQALLPELFCCRTIGDGFGSVISSIYHALNNRGNAPLNEIQLRSILTIITRIHSEPFVEYEEAVEEIINLESAGFEVSPPHFSFVAELLNG